MPEKGLKTFDKIVMNLLTRNNMKAFRLSPELKEINFQANAEVVQSHDNKCAVDIF